MEKFGWKVKKESEPYSLLNYPNNMEEPNIEYILKLAQGEEIIKLKLIKVLQYELPIEIAGSDDIVRGTHVVILTLDVSGQLVTLTLPLIVGRLSTETVPVIATNGLYTIADLNIVSIDKLSKSPDTSVKVNLK